MLWKLLVEYLRPHRTLLLAVVIFQLAQSIASLYLPTLNADIIDEGVAKANIGYILSLGGVMLAITLLQIVCAVIAVYFAAKAAMGVGRDLRARSSNAWGSSPNRKSPSSAHPASLPGPPTTSSRSSSWCSCPPPCWSPRPCSVSAG